MYFKEKSNTNIDTEFKNNNNFITSIINFIKKFKLIFIILILILIIIPIIIYFIPSNNKTYLILNGEETINIYINSDYIEPGFKAYSKKDKDLSNEVKVNSNLNTKEIGSYEITYTLDNITKTRKINVVEKPNELTFIHLTPVNNDIDIYLNIGDEFKEPGYKVFSSSNEDLTKKVKVIGSVDTSKKGIYKLTYTVIDNNGITISKSRLVTIMDTEINLSLNNNEYTNQDVEIKVTITDDLFDYLILPDNTKTENKQSTYKVSSNGKYKFITYNKKGIVKETSIEVSNIDKTAPSGTCTGSYGSGKSTITINANDNIGIKKYIVNETEYENNKIIINKELTNVNVDIVDKANNKKNISCTLKISYDKPIEASGNKTIKNISTNTLKVWIEEYSTYYVSHIWAQNPYKQFKSAIPNNFGKELQTSKALLTKETNNRNLQNKVIIAVNASGIVKNGTWDSEYYAANHEWNLTSVSPIVIVDGKVIRNISNGKIPSSKHITYGLKKDGNLEYYTYKPGTNLKENIDTSNKIINDGVLYTFAFNPVLVLNNKTVSSNTSPNIRQGFCQIDKNNFVFITNKANRDTGFSFKSLGDYMVKLGCKTGFNLDGGGSASLLLKDSSNTITTIANSNRAIADIVYFHE